MEKPKLFPADGETTHFENMKMMRQFIETHSTKEFRIRNVMRKIALLRFEFVDDMDYQNKRALRDMFPQRREQFRDSLKTEFERTMFDRKVGLVKWEMIEKYDRTKRPYNKQKTIA